MNGHLNVKILRLYQWFSISQWDLGIWCFVHAIEYPEYGGRFFYSRIVNTICVQIHKTSYLLRLRS